MKYIKPEIDVIVGDTVIPKQTQLNGCLQGVRYVISRLDKNKHIIILESIDGEAFNNGSMNWYIARINCDIFR